MRVLFNIAGLRYLSEYGWYVVLVVVCMGVVWVKVGPSVKEWWRKKKEREEELNFGEECREMHVDSAPKLCFRSCEGRAV